jgi:hypothetical protein
MSSLLDQLGITQRQPPGATYAAGTAVQVGPTPIQVPTSTHITTLINTGQTPITVAVNQIGNSQLEQTTSLVLQGGAATVWTQATCWAECTATGGGTLYVQDGNVPYFNPNQTLVGPQQPEGDLLTNNITNVAANNLQFASVTLPQRKYDAVMVAILPPLGGPLLFTCTFFYNSVGIIGSSWSDNVQTYDGWTRPAIFILPTPYATPGDTVSCNVQWSGAPILNPSGGVFGVRSLPDNMRSDGRIPPKGLYLGNASASGAIATPGLATRIFLKYALCLTATGGTSASSFASVNGPVQGSTFSVLQAITGVGQGSRASISQDWPLGILFDPGQSVNAQISNAGGSVGGAICSIGYDIVS